MSHFDAMMLRVQAAAFKVGVGELAKRANINERTLRRLLRTPPQQVASLKALDEAAAKIVEDES